MARRKQDERSGALTAEDWVRAAHDAVAEGGVGALAVEPLARRLGVTKGSFYWHFANRGALLEAVLGRWEEEATGSAIAATRLIADPRERLVRLAEEAFGESTVGEGGGPRRGIFLGRAFELAVSDAADDPVVGPVLRRVTERRMDYLEECYRGLGFATEEARHRALLVYAVHAGTIRLFRDAPGQVPRGEGYLAYRRHLVSTLVPGGGTSAAGGG